jgi:creatinine amidohydrolase
MKWLTTIFCVSMLLPVVSDAQSGGAPDKRRSARIADLSWVQAEQYLDTSTVVVIPLGAEAKEHGPHLTLRNDQLLAQYYAERVFAATPVAMYPMVTYHFYPAFVDYPGSTTLRLETARDMIVDIVRSIARHGPRRFYILNTGVSTVRALTPARDSLAASGIVMTFTNGGPRTRAAEDRLRQQPGGTHADEFETSMMLYMYPDRVDMSKAAKDFHPGVSPLVRDSARAARDGRTWSRTGIFGDATLATRQKGRVVVEAHVEDILEEIEALRRMPIPPR